MFFEEKPEVLDKFRRMGPVVIDAGEAGTIATHPRQIEEIAKIIGRTVRVIDPISNEGEIPKPYVYVEPPVDGFMLKKPA